MPFARLLAAAGALALLVPAAATAELSEIYFFGDSLTDTGNVCTGLTIETGYKTGRCSNGDVWSDLLAEAFGLDAEASLEGGNNFAFGGARTDDLDIQIDAFELRFLGDADPDALYAIWIGGNDVLDMPGSPGAMQEAVDRVVDGIEDLRDLGAEEFLVVNLPDVGRAHGGFSFPEGSGSRFTPAERDLLTDLTLEFNAALDTALDGVTGVTLHRFDAFALEEEIFASPAAFGFSDAAIDTTSDDTAFAIPCRLDPACLDDPQGPIADTFILFDAVHPTTATHELIAQRAVTAVPEPSLALLQAAAIATLAGVARAARRRPPRSG